MHTHTTTDAVDAAETTGTSPPCAKWLTAREAAEYLRCSPKRVQNLSGPATAAAERLPFHGGALGKRFHRDELDAWVRARLKAVV